MIGVPLVFDAPIMMMIIQHVIASLENTDLKLMRMLAQMIPSLLNSTRYLIMLLYNAKLFPNVC